MKLISRGRPYSLISFSAFFLLIGYVRSVPPYSFYHTVDSKDGLPFSFRNLKIRFESNDVVSGDEVEAEQREADRIETDFYDVETDAGEEAQEVRTTQSVQFQIPTTPSPLEFTSLTTPGPKVGLKSIAAMRAWLSDPTKLNPPIDEEPEVSAEQLGPKYSLKAWISKHDYQKSNSPADDEEVEYPVNDEIPGLKELLQLTPLIVPIVFAIRAESRRAENGLQDDEDYAEGRWFGSTIEPVDSTDKSKTETTSQSTSTTRTVEDEDSGLSNSTAEATNGTIAVRGRPKEMSPEDERIFAFFGLLFEPQDEDEEYVVDTANETTNQFVLTAREILHSDPLGRADDELRELLTDVSRLEVEVENAHRDYGASFLLPVLKAVEYDNNSVPIVFADIPVNVRVALNVIYLGNFDSMDMEYSIDLEMQMSWFDVRLANNYTKPIRIREKEILDLIWRPDPYFVNSKFSYFHVVSFPNFRMRVMPTGLVQYTLRVTLLPICLMTFCRYPHDDQQCDLKISSIAYSRSFVNFTWHSDPVHYNSRVSLPELRVKRLFTEGCRVEGKLIPSSCLRLGIQLERDGARYIAEKYIPSCLAMMFAWVAPYVPYNYEDVRIITPITVLLTLVQMEKGGSEIHTSYLTSMDIWFVAMKTFSVLSLIESLAVLALIKRSRGVKKQMIRAPNEYEREKFRLQKRRLTQLYHQMDTLSRFLSPLLFLNFLVYYVLVVSQRDEITCLGRSIFDLGP